MSLSARIAFGPSFRVALLAIAVATGGIVVAAVTAAACLPDEMPAVIVVAVAGCGLVIARIAKRHRATPRLVLSFSDHPDIGVDGSEFPWRLVDPTMTWCGFSMLALANGDAPSRPAVLHYPLFGTDIASSDRRALSRFLMWSLRGGGTDGHA